MNDCFCFQFAITFCDWKNNCFSALIAEILISSCSGVVLGRLFHDVSSLADTGSENARFCINYDANASQPLITQNKQNLYNSRLR